MFSGFYSRFAWAAGLVAASLLLLLDPPCLRAQAVNLGLGGGATVPTGDYGSVDNVGWQGMALVTVEFPRTPLALRLDGTFGQTNHQESIPGHSRVVGGTANLLAYLGPQTSRIRPYLLAGGGVYDVRVDVTGFGSASETKPALAGGLGVSARLGGQGAPALFVEGRFVTVRTSGGATNFVPISAGVTFPVR